MPSQTFFNLSQEKREALTEIAINEFSTHDYNSASISRIVQEAGIAKGSFYQYFQDKKDLYLYLIGLVRTAKLSFLQQTCPPEPQMDFFDYLAWLFEVSISFDLVYPALSRLGYRAFYGDLPFRDQAIEGAKEASSEFIRQLVFKGVSEGDIDPNIDLDIAVFAINTLISAFGSYVPTKLGITPEQLAQERASILNTESAKNIFKELLQVLKFGLANYKNKTPSGI